MTDRPITWPFGGRSTELSFAGQAELTTLDSKNVRALDARTQRLRGAQRPGHTKWLSTAPEAGQPIKLIGKITHPQKTGDWSLATAATTEPPGAGEVQKERETKPPSQGQPYDVAIDEQGSRYALDGSTGIAKYSADIRLTSSPRHSGSKGGTWTFPLDREDGDHVLRTLDVDRFGGAYAAVTEGGNPETSRIWCVETDQEVMRLTGNDEPRLRWQIQVNQEDPAGNPYGYGHVGQLRWKNGLLYTVQNNPRSRKSWCVVYELLNSSAPLVQRAFPIPYPAHGIAVKDNGEVVVTCPADANRGTLAPTHASTPKPAFAGIWNPEDDLTDYSTRIWSWLSADLPMPDGSDPLVTVKDSATGEERVIQWLDRSGKGRNIYRDTVDGRGAPYVLKNGLGGRRGVEFRGAEALISLANNVVELEQADLQKSLLPGYKGAAFALCMVVELVPSTTKRHAILGVYNEANPTSFDFDRVLIANRQESTAFGTPTAGNIEEGRLMIHEYSEFARSGGSIDPPISNYATTSAPQAASFNKTSVPSQFGTTLVTPTTTSPTAGVLMYVCDGNLDSPSSENRSCWYWNGSPIDRWNSQSIEASGRVEVGGYTKGSVWDDLEGVIYEIFVLDRKDRSDDTAGVLTTPQYPDLTAVSSPGGGVGLVHILTQGSGLTNGNGTWSATGGTTDASGRWLVSGNALVQMIVDDPGSGFTTPPTVTFSGLSGSVLPTTAAKLYDPTSETELEKIIGYFAHRYGIQHLLDPGDGTRLNKRLSTGETAYGNSEEFGAFTQPYRTSAPIPTGKPDVNDLWSTDGILVKYGADEDSPTTWILTNSDAYGYGVEIYPSAVDSEDEETGAQDILVAGPGPTSDIARVTDSGASAVIDWLGGLVGDTDNPYVRMAIDEAGTAYVPSLPDTISGAGSVFLRNESGTALLTWKSDASDSNANQGAYAVAIPARIPGRLSSTKFYENDIAIASMRAEEMFVALDHRDNENRVNGTGGTTGKNTLIQAKLVEFTENGDPPRRTVFVTGANANFKRQRPGDATFSSPTGGAGLLAATVDAFYDGTPHFGKFYVVDGIDIFVYDPHAEIDEIKKLTATRGKIPRRVQQIYSWNSRLVALRGDSDDWVMSARNDPRNWDTDPVVPTPNMAIGGSLLDRGPGSVPDVMNTFVPVTTNIGIAGCDSSIHIFRGDPAVGTIELVSDQIGMAWGPSWAMLPEGVIFFIDPQGDAYLMSETGSKPQEASRDKIGLLLRDIDWSTHYYRCVYSPEEDGVRVLRVPRDAGGTTVAQWFWSRRTGGWEEDEYGAVTRQPTSAVLFDGDAAADRVLVFGCEDGHLRYVDPDADDDDGEAIDSYQTFGPLGERNSMRYTMFTHLRILLDSTRDGAVNYQLFVTDDPMTLGEPALEGVLQPGYNTVTCRKTGSYVYLRLRALDSGSWAFEEALMDVRFAGERKAAAR